MANVVIKKSGKKERFNKKKIRKSLEAAARKAKLDRKKREKLINDVLQKIITYSNQYEELTTAEIRDLALMELDLSDPSVMRAWLAYEVLKIKKKRKKYSQLF